MPVPLLPGPVPLGLVYHPNERVSQVGGLDVRLGTIDLDSSYPTGGYPWSNGAIGFRDATGVVVFGNAGGYVLEFDTAAQKVLLYQEDTGANTAMAQVPAYTDLRATKRVPYVAWGV